MDCVFTKIIDYNENIIDRRSKFATIMDCNDNILDTIFSIIIDYYRWNSGAGPPLRENPRYASGHLNWFSFRFCVKPIQFQIENNKKEER